MAGVKKQGDEESSRSQLRAEAEKKVTRSAAKSALLKKQGLDKLVHELRVHQVELEMQIEEFQHAQEELKISQERYFELYDLAPVGYFSISEKGIILESNLTGANMLGVVPRELRAQRFTSLILPQDQDIYYLHRRQLFATQSPQVCEFRMVRRDGSHIWVRIEATLAKDAKSGKTVCLATMSDITRQKQAELALRREWDRIQVYLDTVETVIVALDTEGRITSINRKGCRLFECREGELIGQLWFSTCLPQPDGMEKVYPFFLKLIAGELEAAEYFENPVVTRKGEVRQVAWHNALLRDEQGCIIGTLSSGDDITELKQMQEALLASEEKYRTVADFTSDWEYWLSPDGSYIYVSPSCKEITGYGPEAFMQDPDFMLKIIHPDDRNKLLRHRKKDPGHDEKYKSLDFRIITRGGDERWIGHRCRKVYGRDGSYLGKRGSNRDITERRLEHIALQKRNKEQKCIYSISSLSEAPDISVEELLNRAVMLIPWGMQFTEVTETRITLEGRAFQTAFFHETPWMMASNIIIAGKKAGQLEVCYLEEQPAEDEGPFLKEERHLIEVVASRLGHMISRIRTEKTLQLSEANYRNLVENVGEGICVIQDGLFKFVNRALAATAGLPVDEMTNKPFTDYVHPDDREMIVERESRRVSGEKFDGSYSFRALNNEGQTRWLSLSAVLITWEGKPATLNFLQDVTERKEFVEALRESEERYRNIARLSSEFAYSCVHTGDDGYKVDWITDAFFTLTGYTKTELREQGCWMFTSHPDDHEIATKPLRELNAGESNTREFRIVTRDGRVLYIINYMECVEDPDAPGGLRLFGAVQNITERKRAEEALRDSEELFRVAQEMSPDGFTILSPLRNEKGEIIDFKWVYENETIARINGTDPEEVKGKRVLDLFPTHKGTSIFEAYVHVSNSGKSQIIEDVYVGEIVSRPTWLRLVIVSIGEDIAILAQDITEHKQVQEELEKSRRELRNLSEHLLTVREEDRKLLAREIHDELGQALTALKMDLSWLSKKLPAGQEPQEVKIASMLNLIDTAMKTVKRISTELRPGMLDDLGLMAAMEWQAGEFQKRTGIKTELGFEPADIRVDDEQSIALFRIFQELLTNIARHASATIIDASLREKDGALELSVRDNGIGIKTKMLTGSKSFGLMGMRERCGYLGGTIDIRGNKGKGTTVTVNLPARETLR